VVIRGDDGYQYDYWHGSRVIADHGQRVAAGQLIMLLGNTGHSTGPHLHFGITRPGGGKICPQSLLVDWFNFVATPPSGSTPSTGCIGPSLRGR
jgi:murein DD-endopeptidase MepM/ murein hydrolase activator NlpD